MQKDKLWIFTANFVAGAKDVHVSTIQYWAEEVIVQNAVNPLDLWVATIHRAKRNHLQAQSAQ